MPSPEEAAPEGQGEATGKPGFSSAAKGQFSLHHDGELITLLEYRLSLFALEKKAQGSGSKTGGSSDPRQRTETKMEGRPGSKREDGNQDGGQART